MCPRGHRHCPRTPDTLAGPQANQPFAAGTHPAFIPSTSNGPPSDMSIRDPSAQDIPVASARPGLRARRPWLIGGALGVAGLLLVAWLLSGLGGGRRS